MLGVPEVALACQPYRVIARIRCVAVDPSCDRGFFAREEGDTKNDVFHGPFPLQHACTMEQQSAHEAWVASGVKGAGCIVDWHACYCLANRDRLWSDSHALAWPFSLPVYSGYLRSDRAVPRFLGRRFTVPA